MTQPQNRERDSAAASSLTETKNPMRYVLAFDTANETIAVSIGRLIEPTRTVEVVASTQTQARRASNTRLLNLIDGLCHDACVKRSDIACVAVGIGPGSFTGVRIALATAKGIAEALEVALIGVSSLDSVAWNAWAHNIREELLVVADAMRQEVYPARFTLDDKGAHRQNYDRVMKVDLFERCEKADDARQLVNNDNNNLHITGDALAKYADVFEPYAPLCEDELWTPTGAGILLALQAAWRAEQVDPFDALRHAPAFVLPVYTRLSDAEESERARIARAGDDEAIGTLGRDSRHVTMNDTAISNARANEEGLVYKPLDRAHVGCVAHLESLVAGSDAWNEAQVVDELGRVNRTWWTVYAADPAAPLTPDALLVGYAGGLVVDGDLQVLKIGVDPAYRRRGIARELFSRLISDARNLGAQTCSLEVRASNTGAQDFYRNLGLEEVGVRPRYYSDKEDALIMKGTFSRLKTVSPRDTANMDVHRCDQPLRDSQCNEATVENDRVAEDAGGAPDIIEHPLILAIESSCDETGAALVNGNGVLISDVVASQVDFHARFGGVVPEIAGRKHIEAICGVCDVAFDAGADAVNLPCIRWRDLDAVAATYTPGLVGALVVGVAFAKGVAWAADIPFIGVNHLEGHLYANKLGDPDFKPPAVVSLVSGGNTMLVYMRDWGDYTTLGATIDDAVGEAFDKIAKALGLGYPGGPAITRYAAAGDPYSIDFPRAMMHSGDMRFSLSGLKTAVVTYINQERAAGRELNIANIAASFQQAVIDVQIKKARMALEQTGAPTFCLGGGVAANPELRDAYVRLCADMGVKLVMPPLDACGDNAAMIALVALDRYREGKFFGLDADASAQSDLDERY